MHLEVPEDVRAELDAEERRRAAPPVPLPMRDSIPEEVRSELDHEEQLASEEQRTELIEGGPPAASDEETPAST